MSSREDLTPETPKGDAHVVCEKMHTYTGGDALPSVVALRARKMGIDYRELSTETVHIPRDMKVFKNGCNIELALAENQGAIALPGTTEDSHHLKEWETFTRALLIFHSCISDLTLCISAVRRSPGLFYQSITLRSGKARIDVEVSAYTAPYRDFMLPFVCHLFRLRNPDETEIQTYNLPDYDDMDLREHICPEHLIQNDSPRLNDSRIVKIIEVAMSIPSLVEFRVEVDNTISVPDDLPDIGAFVTSSGSSELRRLRYDVDVGCAPLLQCAHLQDTTCGQHLDTSLLPKLCARREITGSKRDLVPFSVELGNSNYISSSLYISLRRDGDPSD
ncbi:uncharacterized protein LOC142776580 [Rhipicephalus microplus]|uniref:uncharacterized protein LOC142776580 n=1 Tax=Rhipicephalus microplus TaxID=6941 RepID=UPI003F6B54E5